VTCFMKPAVCNIAAFSQSRNKNGIAHDMEEQCSVGRKYALGLPTAVSALISYRIKGCHRPSPSTGPSAERD
jgi:hypothetical protein